MIAADDATGRPVHYSISICMCSVQLRNARIVHLYIMTVNQMEYVNTNKMFGKKLITTWHDIHIQRMRWW